MQTTSINEMKNPAEFDPAERLFRHKAKPEWGVGLWVREEPTKRRLRFKDGTLRTFKKGFYHLLSSVDVDRVDVDTVFEEIAGKHEIMAFEERAANARLSSPPVMSFKEQIRVFNHLYPGGFKGDAYQAQNRRPVGKKKSVRKSHLGLVSERARGRLSKERLTTLLNEEGYDTIHADAVDILNRTSTVSLSNDVKPLKALEPEQREAFAKGLVYLLHGEERFTKRFGAWLKMLRSECGLKVKWPLATIFPALVFPRRHVCAKQRVFELQARTVRPGTSILNHPTAGGYQRLLQVAKATRRELTGAGMGEPDFLDVRTFIWETLRPKGKTLLKEL